MPRQMSGPADREDTFSRPKKLTRLTAWEGKAFDILMSACFKTTMNHY